MRALALVALLSSGCLRTVNFTCASDTDCGTGKCEPTTRFCSFADPGCSSGFRYGALAGDSSNKCTNDVGGDGGHGSFTIGGHVTGLTAPSFALQDNGADDKVITANGAYTFATALDTGEAYNVVVFVQPMNQACTVANAMGTVASAPISDVDITCSSIGNGISCGGATCSNGTQKCCHSSSTSTGSCKASGGNCQNGTFAELCDDAGDCGGGSNICCAPIASNGRLAADIVCVSSPAACTGGATQQYLCDPAASSPCPGTMTCVLDATFGWHRCQ